MYLLQNYYFISLLSQSFSSEFLRSCFHSKYWSNELFSYFLSSYQKHLEGIYKCKTGSVLSSDVIASFKEQNLFIDIRSSFCEVVELLNILFTINLVYQRLLYVKKIKNSINKEVDVVSQYINANKYIYVCVNFTKLNTITNVDELSTFINSTLLMFYRNNTLLDLQKIKIKYSING